MTTAPVGRRTCLGGRWLVARRAGRCCSRSSSATRSSATTCSDRYADPSFTTPGLNAAFAWAATSADARIATTSTRQYPLFGTDLSNHVQFIGSSAPTAASRRPTSCRAWRRALDDGDYDYVVATRDRIEPGKPPYPPQARWTEGPERQGRPAEAPTVVFRLTGPLDPSACRLSGYSGGWHGWGRRERSHRSPAGAPHP